MNSEGSSCSQTFTNDYQRNIEEYRRQQAARYRQSNPSLQNNEDKEDKQTQEEKDLMLALEIQENLNRITPDVVDRPTPRKVLDNDEELARQIQMEDDDVLSFLTSDEEPLPTVTSNVTRTTNRATQSPTASRSSGRGRGRARSAVAPVTRTPRIHVEPNPPMPDCSQDEEMARILQEQMNEPLVEDDPIFFSDDDDLIPQFVMPSMLPQRSRIQPLPAFGTEHPFYPNATSPLPPHLQSILPVLDPFTAIEAQLLDPSGPSRSRRRLPRYSNNRIPTHLRAIAEDEDADYESLLALDELTEPVNRGASTDQLQSLPTRTYVTGSMKREEASCGICLTEYEQGDKLKSLPRCLHSFHSPCIDKWLSINKICPVCRADIN